MLRILSFFLLLFVAAACNSNTDKETETADKTPKEVENTSPGEILYPSITLEEMQDLWANTTAVDYLFYELPISMNMVERPAIESTLRQISDKAAYIKKDCKAMGRVFFQNKGASLAEADFYFTPQCTYFVFIEDQKPVKSNQMTSEGVKFFQNLLATAQHNQ